MYTVIVDNNQVATFRLIIITTVVCVMVDRKHVIGFSLYRWPDQRASKKNYKGYLFFTPDHLKLINEYNMNLVPNIKIPLKLFLN